VVAKVGAPPLPAPARIADNLRAGVRKPARMRMHCAPVAAVRKGAGEATAR
jgi:hypothetical protein